MEALVEVGIASAAAVMLISLYMIMRIMMRSESSPSFLRSTLAAYAFAVPFTIAVAGSFAYVTYALTPFAGVGLGIVGSVAVHSAFLGLFLVLLPVRSEQAQAAKKDNRVSASDAVAA